MDVAKIALLIFACFVCFCIFCVVMLKFISKYFVIQHAVYITLDDGTLRTVDDKRETFQIVNGVEVPTKNDDTLKVTTKCGNQSLNDMHKLGTMEKAPLPVSCNAKTQDEEPNAIKKFKAPLMYEQAVDILGANYMTYNSNPNPYHLDFSLYDKDAPANKVVGTNYVSDYMN